MNAFLHAVFPGRQTDVKIKKDGKSLRVEISAVVGERIVIEVNSLGELKLEGFDDGEHNASDSH